MPKAKGTYSSNMQLCIQYSTTIRHKHPLRITVIMIIYILSLIQRSKLLSIISEYSRKSSKSRNRKFKQRKIRNKLRNFQIVTWTLVILSASQNTGPDQSFLCILWCCALLCNKNFFVFQTLQWVTFTGRLLTNKTGAIARRTPHVVRANRPHRQPAPPPCLLSRHLPVSL